MFSVYGFLARLVVDHIHMKLFNRVSVCSSGARQQNSLAVGHKASGWFLPGTTFNYCDPILIRRALTFSSLFFRLSYQMECNYFLFRINSVHWGWNCFSSGVARSVKLKTLLRQTSWLVFHQLSMLFVDQFLPNRDFSNLVAKSRLPTTVSL